MPTYDYECSSCNSSFELFQKMSDNPIKKCPNCGKNTAKRLIGSGMGIIFKGSGFYETDYKRSNASTNSGGDKAKESQKDKENKSSSAESKKKDEK